MSAQSGSNKFTYGKLLDMALHPRIIANLKLAAARLDQEIAVKKKVTRALREEFKTIIESGSNGIEALRKATNLRRRHRKVDNDLRELLSQKDRIAARVAPSPIPLGGYSEIRGLRDHEAFFNHDFGKVIAEALARKEKQGQADPVAHVCDLSVGHGRVLWELKDAFGDKVITHGTALPNQLPTNRKFKAGIDVLNVGNNLDPKSGFRQSGQKYDFMFSRRGEKYEDLQEISGAVLSKLAKGGLALIQLTSIYPQPHLDRLIRKIEAAKTHGQFKADLHLSVEPGKNSRVPSLIIRKES